MEERHPAWEQIKEDRGREEKSENKRVETSMKKVKNKSYGGKE